MKKLAIIGAGISGLTAAYEAGKEDIDTVLFEEGFLAGGRLEYCVSATTPEFQPLVYELIEELGLEGLTVPLPPALLGMYVKGEIMPYSHLPKMIESMPEDQQKVVNEMIGEALQSNFSVKDPSENLKELRKISFAEYLEEFSPKTLKMLVEPMMVFTFLENVGLEDLSAEYGLFQMRFGLEMGKENVSTFEEGIRILADVLEERAQEEGVDIQLESRVTRIEETDNGFKVSYRKSGKKEEMEVEQVVLSTPFSSIKMIFPEIELGEGLSYSETKCFIAQGELKGDEKIIMGVPGNKTNLRFLFAGPYGTHYIYPFKNDEPVDMDVFYKDYRITDEKMIENPMPIMAPDTELPRVETNIDGAYLCGDYYYYPLIETSIATAREAIEKVKKEL